MQREGDRREITGVTCICELNFGFGGSETPKNHLSIFFSASLFRHGEILETTQRSQNEPSCTDSVCFHIHICRLSLRAAVRTRAAAERARVCLYPEIQG